MERQIFVAVQNERKGPYPESQVRQMLATGSVSPSDLGWYQGMSNWAPLAQIVPPMAAAAAQIPGIPDIPDYQPRPMPSGFANKGPSGVGGWLLFYCILLTIITPILSFGSMASNWQSSMPAFEKYPSLKTGVMIENSVLALITIAGVVVGIALWVRASNAKRMIQAFLIGRLVIFIAVEAIVVAVVTSKASEIAPFLTGAAIGSCIREGIYFAIWFSYFGRSVRVMNTYG